MGVIVILFLDFFLIKGLVLQFESRNYPGTTGVITHSAIASREIVSSSPSGQQNQEGYGVNFNYDYKVNGQSFEGARFRYDQFFWTHEWAQQQVAAHPVGSQVQVFYNPQNPTDAVLVAGVGAGDKPLFLILALFNLIAAFLGWCFVRNFPKRLASRRPAGGMGGKI